MANIGPNKGFRLNFAFKQFASMLIEEARDISKCTFFQLDEALEIGTGESERYLHMETAPTLKNLQKLEDNVAKLLKRIAHEIVIDNYAKFDSTFHATILSGSIEGRPRVGINLRKYPWFQLKLVYRSGWPTYKQLKYDQIFPETAENRVPIKDLLKKRQHDLWPPMLKLYSWQWGILWDENLPWLSRADLNIPNNAAVETFLPAIAHKSEEATVYCGLALIHPECMEFWDMYQDELHIANVFDTDERLKGLTFEGSGDFYLSCISAIGSALHRRDKAGDDLRALILENLGRNKMLPSYREFAPGIIIQAKKVGSESREIIDVLFVRDDKGVLNYQMKSKD